MKHRAIQLAWQLLVPIEHVAVAIVLIDHRRDANIQVIQIATIELGPINVVALPIRWVEIQKVVAPWRLRIPRIV